MNDNQTQYIKAAITLARAICRDAIWSNGSCNWIGSSNEDFYGMPKPYAKALSSNFYDGTAGIAFFLTALCQVEKDTIIEKTAHGALQQVIDQEVNQTIEGDALYGKLGFYTGWTGCAYVLYYASRVFDKPVYATAAKRLIDQCIQLPLQYWGLDVIEGPAGAIPALKVIYNDYPADELKGFIIKLGTYLLDKADRNNGTTSWNTMPDKTNNLTGYGHGAAGFAHAFAELYQLTNDESYLKVVDEIIRYEDEHYNKEQQNWPDFRNFAGQYFQPQQKQQVCGLAWCHGAPGIGLSRLRTYAITRNVAAKNDAEIAIQTTIENANIESVGNYSLCHGLFGNSELLLNASEVLQQPYLKEKAYNLADDCILAFLQKQLPIPNGLQTLCETPDFMLGSSGIGYFFLRLSDTAKFPCTLLLQ